MALQIAALNDEPFIFVIFTNSSAFPLWDLSRTGGAYYPLSDCLAGVAVRRNGLSASRDEPRNHSLPIKLFGVSARDPDRRERL